MLTAAITVSAAAAINTTPIAHGQIVTEAVEAEKVAISENRTEQLVREYFRDIPIMVEIARCESQFRQFDRNGQVLKNPNSSAKGAFQIMESIHTATASKLGHDILTLEGNAAYARYLYEKEGTRPWNASAACWKKTLAYSG